MKNGEKNWFKLDNAAKIFPGQNSRSWSNVFRLSVQLKEEVDPAVLEIALNNTLKRFPWLNVKIKSGFFWYYLETNPNKAKVNPDVKNYCYRINFKENAGFLFRVYYYVNRISVDVYHAITDGYGCTVFISTLTAEYLRLKYGAVIPKSKYVLSLSDKPTKDEMSDAYIRFASSKAKYNRRDKVVYHAKGTKLPAHLCNYTVGIMSFKQLHEVTKSYGVTVTEFFAALLMYIHYKKQLSKSKKQREVSVQIPVNLRKFYDTNTLRNFVLCLRVKIDPQKGEYTFEEILKLVSLQLRLVDTEKEVNSMMTQNLKIERNKAAKIMPLFVKNLSVKVTFLITGEQTTSSLISNIGLVTLPEEMQKYVDNYSFFTGPGILNGARCGAITYGDKLCFTFSNCYEESDIEREFFTTLVKLGISVKIESNRE